MTDLSPEARALLDRGREALSPGPDAKERVLSSIDASLAAGSGAGAAAMGSSIRYTSRAPAEKAGSFTALFSTGVTPEGTEIIIRGRTNFFLL